VYQVKVIGALGMIDGTDLETDWKVFVINIKRSKGGKHKRYLGCASGNKESMGNFLAVLQNGKRLKREFLYDPESIKKVNADPVWLGAKEARKIVLSSAAAYQKLVGECLNRKVKNPIGYPDVYHEKYHDTMIPPPAQRFRHFGSSYGI